MSPSSSPSLPLQSSSTSSIILLDHININHKKRTHHLLTNFYITTLNLTLDPRRSHNLGTDQNTGGGTLWMNAGATQFHLSEGNPEAQVFDGFVYLDYFTEDDLTAVMSRCLLNSVVCEVTSSSPKPQVKIKCPYGNTYICRVLNADASTNTQKQPGEASKSCAGISCIELFVKSVKDLEGIARFYEHTFNAVMIQSNISNVENPSITIKTHANQSLVFSIGPIMNDDYVDGEGVHISLFVSDLKETWGKMNALNLIYINPRYKNSTSTLPAALDEMMFRILNIVDPIDNRFIIRLEHEIRSITTADGGMRNPSFPV